MFGNIFYGLLLIISGFLIIKYRKQVYSWTGGWGWVEHYLGRGSTYGVMILLASAMVVLGIAKFFGLVEFRGSIAPPQTKVSNTSSSSSLNSQQNNN